MFPDPLNTHYNTALGVAVVIEFVPQHPRDMVTRLA
uniref:Uncharacterized protein n=1 Tax=Arundo donax TaxID=35708 RepID=A0A0A8YBE4_ARUDO